MTELFSAEKPSLKKPKEKCPFHPVNGGDCDLAVTAISYCHSWCKVRQRLKKDGMKG